MEGGADVEIRQIVHKNTRRSTNKRAHFVPMSPFEEAFVRVTVKRPCVHSHLFHNTPRNIGVLL